MKTAKLLVTLGAIVALTSCGLTGVGTADIKADITPGFGFEVDDELKITIPGPDVQFWAAPGSAGALITDYEIAFLDSAGAPFRSTDYKVSGSLPVKVASGFACESVPSGSTGGTSCSINDPTTIAAAGPKSEIMEFTTIQGDVPEALLNHYAETGMSMGWYARITFNGVDDNGRPITWSQNEPIIWPLSGD
jgi:hypothetical protein